MLTEITMPKIGYTMEEGTLVRWLKKAGDSVTLGEPLFEVSSDKANMEIDSPASGYLRKIMAKEGENVPVLKVIGYLGDEDEPLPAEAGAVADLPEADEPAFQARKKSEATAQEALQQPRLSPRARKLAQEHCLSPESLREIRGAGVRGLVTERDLKVLLEKNMPHMVGEQLPHMHGSTGPKPIEIPMDSHPVKGKLTPASRYRQVIARRLTQSIQEVPQFVTGVEVDAGALLKFRERLNGKAADHKVSITCLLIKCAAKAICDHMTVNASWRSEGMEFHKEIGIGVAMATERGLAVPVVAAPDKKGLFEIMTDLALLQEKAKAGTLSPMEISGGTFTVSNLGMYEVDSFQAIINPPESGILAVGRIVRKPVVMEEETVTVRPRMWLNLTCDHRVMDGADAAVLLGKIKLYIEYPEMLVV